MKTRHYIYAVSLGLTLAMIMIGATRAEPFTIDTVYDLRDNNAQWSHHPAHQAKWNRFLARLGVEGLGVSAMTDAELDRKASRSEVWARAKTFLTAREAVVEEPLDPPQPVQAEVETVTQPPPPPVETSAQTEDLTQCQEWSVSCPDHLKDFDEWNRWGRWAHLDPATQQALHGLPSIEDVRVRGLNAGHSFVRMNSLPTITTNGTVTWRSDDSRGSFEAVLHPSIADDHSNPVMLLEYNIDNSEWYAAVEYTVSNDGVYPDRIYDTSRPCGNCGPSGRDRFHSVPHPQAGQQRPDTKYHGDRWNGLTFTNGGVDHDGLTAQFFQQIAGATHRGSSSTHVIGTVQRPKIVGTFLTGIGRRK